MTIVTKPLSEKKAEKPLFESIQVDVVPERAHGVPLVTPNDLQDMRERRARSATGCLLFSALIVMSVGIVTGLYVYKHVLRERMEKFHLRCNIPYTAQGYTDQDMESLQNDLAALKDKVMDQEENYFHEDFEIDDNYEKITVPDFSGGRQSKFIHDFHKNKTGIVDLEGQRCFVFPLNRSVVLQPGNLMDLVKKMRSGYYDVDTTVLRETMRVITPAIEDKASLGHFIERECYNYPVYALEKVVSGVYKRSAEPEVKFMEFAGKNTVELFIINYKDLQEHEVLMPVAMA